MSFNAFRLPIRRAAALSSRTAAPSALRTSLRTRGVRWNTGEAKPASGGSNTTLYVGLALAAAAGAGYYVYTSDDPTAREAKTAIKSAAQVTKAATNFTPTKEDYQKVYNKVASILEADYDGKSIALALYNCFTLKIMIRRHRWELRTCLGAIGMAFERDIR